MVTDRPVEVEIHLGSIPTRRSDERMDDSPQTKTGDHKNLPKVAVCSLMGTDRLEPSGLVSGDAGVPL